MNNERYLQIAKENGGLDCARDFPTFTTEEFLATCAAINADAEKRVREEIYTVFEQYERGMIDIYQFAEAIRNWE